MAATTLFKKLYQNGKNIIKSGALDNIERKSKIKIESSIAETKALAYDAIEAQTQMLCDIEKFDHVAFAKSRKELANHKTNLEYLAELMLKLFGDKIDVSIDGDVWDVAELANKNQNQNQSQNNQQPTKEE